MIHKTGRITVRKHFNFCYGHHLPDYDGKCANPHGHNAELRITVAGVSSGIMVGGAFVGSEPYAGMVVDFNDLKAYVQPIIEELDHKDINKIMLPYGAPTAENMVKFIYDKLQDTPFRDWVVKIELSETPTSWAVWEANG